VNWKETIDEAADFITISPTTKAGKELPRKGKTPRNPLATAAKRAFMSGGDWQVFEEVLVEFPIGLDRDLQVFDAFIEIMGISMSRNEDYDEAFLEHGSTRIRQTIAYDMLEHVRSSVNDVTIFLIESCLKQDLLFSQCGEIMYSHPDSFFPCFNGYDY